MFITVRASQQFRRQRQAQAPRTLIPSHRQRIQNQRQLKWMNL